MTKGLILIVMLLSLMTSCSIAKNTEPTKRVVFIQTNAQCGECKERIEGVMNFEKGVIYSNLNVETKVLELKYNSNKTTLATLKSTISEIGYSADEVEADITAQKSLPACCQPGGMSGEIR